VSIRNTIFQLLVFCARFLLWLIVMSLFARIYEAFLQKELFWLRPRGEAQGRAGLIGVRIRISYRDRQTEASKLYRSASVDFRLSDFSLFVLLYRDNCYGIVQITLSFSPKKLTLPSFWLTRICTDLPLSPPNNKDVPLPFSSIKRIVISPYSARKRPSPVSRRS
jgi:hypothetical protein